MIDWDPRHLYRKLIPDEAAMERFLATTCTMEWNLQQDRGRSWQEATTTLAARNPHETALIAAYAERWPEMLAGPIDGTVAILAELHARKTPLYAVTNWSAETFPHARARFDFLDMFDGIVVSGHERVAKPDPAIYRLLMTRYALKAEDLVFIDDNQANVDAASRLGVHAITFTRPEALRRALEALDLLPENG